MTVADLPCPVSADQREVFAREGWLVLRGLIEPGLLAGMREAMAATAEGMLDELRAEGLIPSTRPDLPFATRFAAAAGTHAARFGRSWRKRLAGPGLFALQHSPALVATARALLGGPVCGHPVFNARPKLPHQPLTVVPWHQDSAYFGARSVAWSILTAWIPLVPAHPGNGGMELLPRSHGAGLSPHAPEAGDGAFLEIPGTGTLPGTVAPSLEPGDVLWFGNLFWHRSLPNRSDHVRWSVDLRYHALAQPEARGEDYPEPWIVDPQAGETTPYERWIEWIRASRW